VTVPVTDAAPPWPVRVRQATEVARRLPRVANGGPVVAAAAVALGLVAFTGPSGGVLTRLRLGEVAVAAAAAFAFEDTAAVTLAPSPTPLVVRRLHRVVALLGVLAVWWTAALVVAHLRTSGIAGGALTRELAVLVVLAAVGATAVQWPRPDAPGGIVGAALALAWFGASCLPRIGHVPLPPSALDPRATAQLTAVLAAGVAVFLVLSRDPAARASPVSRGTRRRRTPGSR
jgi:hypothetical protein